MVMSVFVDLRKAFDTMPHWLITKKLEALGARDLELNWFKNYIAGRRQFLKLGNQSSECKSTSIGVQQGSLLGVLLFQLMINNLPQCLKFSGSILYAEDTTTYIYDKSLCFLRMKMQADLNHLSQWLYANDLKLNVGKTKVMLFNKEGLSPNCDLTIDGQLIETVKEFKFLGMYLDITLDFDIHYCSLYKKLTQFCFIIQKLGQFLPRTCLRTLYFKYVHSHLTYDLYIWYPLLSKFAQNTLYLIQKRILRSICKISMQTHCMPFFCEEKILILGDQLLLEYAKLIQ